MRKIYINDMPEKINCEVCGDVMKKFNQVYDSNEYGKTYYKCDNCGHKICKMK